MTIELLYFALVRDITGKSSEKIHVSANTSIKTLASTLIELYPSLAERLTHARWAVNEEFVEESALLQDSDCVAIIMPVSGGGEPEIGRPEFIIVELTPHSIDSQALLQRVTTVTCGAVCLFLGTVREFTGAQQTVDLVYEAYPKMAEKVLRQICEEAASRWPIPRMGVIHRLGLVPLGEASIALAVATPHRQASFEACSWMMDEIKKRVPIWKQEHWADGTRQWVHPQS